MELELQTNFIIKLALVALSIIASMYIFYAQLKCIRNDNVRSFLSRITESWLTPSGILDIPIVALLGYAVASMYTIFAIVSIVFNKKHNELLSSIKLETLFVKRSAYIFIYLLISLSLVAFNKITLSIVFNLSCFVILIFYVALSSIKEKIK